MLKQLFQRSNLIILLYLVTLTPMSAAAQQAKQSTNADLPPLWQLGGHPAPAENTQDRLKVTVVNVNGTIDDSFTIPRRSK